MSPRYRTASRARIADRVATLLITLVGMGTIVAVFGMMAFLVNTVWPLGKSESLEAQWTWKGARWDEPPILALESSTAFFARIVASSDEKGCAVELYHKPKDTDAPEALTRGSLAWDEGQSAFRVLSHEPKLAAPIKAEAGQSRCIAIPENASSFAWVHRAPSGELSVARATLALASDFLSEEELAALPLAALASLNRHGQVAHAGQAYLRPSPVAPVARLRAEAQLNGPFLQFAHGSPDALAFAALLERGTTAPSRDIEFLPGTDAKNGFVALREEGRIAALHWTQRKENPLTGAAAITSRSLVAFLADLRARAPGETPLLAIALFGASDLWAVFGDGRFLRTHFSPEDGSWTAPSSPEMRRPFAVAEFPSLAAVAPLPGGSGLFLDSGSGTCIAIDAAQFGRKNPLASAPEPGASVQPGSQAQSDPAFPIPVLWRSPCAASQTPVLLPARKKRTLVRVADGRLEIFETTTGRLARNETVAELHGQGSVAGPRWALTDDASWMLAADGGEISLFKFDAPHLEASWRSLFLPVQYEGYEDASFQWQSTSGTDDFQPKLSLVPLIWGTVKSTLFAMLFAAPLGIMAAIYTSEIMDRKSRNLVKPAIEMMASLPSVVLGFLAAMVIAPLIEEHVVSVLLLGFGTPFFMFTIGNLLSSASARHVSARGLYASRWLAMGSLTGFLGTCVILFLAGRLIERTAFGGDVKVFLQGGNGAGAVMWGLLLLPLTLVLLWCVPVRRARKAYRTAVFLLGPLAAYALGHLIAGRGADPRGAFMGPYSQRNALVIAIAMGFAIIPLIYSLAEDALTSVPNSLRAASLAAGASVWQTTARVILPVAASGIFSALMIGFGRAIGETMIAVMAAGNAPVMSLNPFEGLRTLSANIAVELPEAAQGSTHYRTLFLSALLLFGFTFILNSLAEFLRGRARERNKAL